MIGLGAVGSARNFLEMNVGWGLEDKTLPQWDSSITRSIEYQMHDFHLKRIPSLCFDHLLLPARHLSSLLNLRIVALVIISLLECL